MYSQQTIRIEIDQLIYTLFCLYAFSMPFELVFEKLFYIDTIFKPFRIFSLAIAGLFFIRTLRSGLQLNPKEGSDIFLYGVFVYGIIISCIQIISGRFNFNLFYNDLFLIGLHLIVFFVYKAMDFDRMRALKMLKYFVAGIFVNAGYIFYTFILKIQFGRQSGFIDNPNYAALGLVAVLAYLLLRLNYDTKLKTRILYVLGIIFLLYIFIITGSRAGLIMFLITTFFVFIFSSLRRKLGLLVVSGFIIFTLLSRGSEYAYLGGSLVLINRVTDKMDAESEDVRFVIWRGMFRLLEEEGYFGMGIGQFKANFPKYYGEESNKLILEIVNRGYHLSPHNDYLAILADYGIPSLSLYLFFLIIAFKKLFRRIIYPIEDDDERFLAQYNFIIFCCLVVFGLAAENFQHQLFWFLLMLSTKRY